MNRHSDLTHVFQAGLQELIEFCQGDAEPTSMAFFYAELNIHFLRGEVDELREKIEAAQALFTDDPSHELFLTACRLRQQIRLRIFDAALISQAIAMTETESLWQGELAILIATLRTLGHDFESASAFYKKAALAFKRIGCLKKSLRCQMNVVVCESHLLPTRNYFSKYYDLYRKAIRKESREIIVATTCLLNISREYQRVGSNLAALKYCNRALTLFEFQMGEINYFLTLAHRAHLLLSLGRLQEARVDFEAARLCSFDEVHLALTAVEVLLEGREKRKSLKAEFSDLSVLEDKLLVFLVTGPRDRIDILDHLYGSKLSFETKLNRFKSVLSSLRKKRPGLILCEDSQYRVSDQLLMPSLSSSERSGS